MRKIYRKPETKIFEAALTDKILDHSNDYGDINTYDFDMEEEEEEDVLYLKIPNVWE